MMRKTMDRSKKMASRKNEKNECDQRLKNKEVSHLKADVPLDFLSTLTALEHENITLKTQNTGLHQKLEEAQVKIKWYEEQLRLNAQKRFGQSADSAVLENQVSFFNESEVTQRPEIKGLPVKTPFFSLVGSHLNGWLFDF